MSGVVDVKEYQLVQKLESKKGLQYSVLEKSVVIITCVPTSAEAGIKERVTVFGSRKVSCDNHLWHRHQESGSYRQTLNEENKLNLERTRIRSDHYWVPGRL